MLRTLSFYLVGISFIQLYAQDDTYPYPSLSPRAKLSQEVGYTSIDIVYERPSARKRQIFGQLVPWNEVWRTGAGHSTNIAFSKDVLVAGQAVPAGTYALFTIPGPKEWIIILNRDTTLYGSYGYDHKKDIARWIVQPKMTSRFYETLTIDIDIIPNDANIFISWANTQVSFLVETGTDTEIETLIEDELLSRKNKNSDIYAGAAEYLLYQGNDLLRAIKLAEMAIELDENNGWARNLKIRCYERLKLYPKALAEIQQFIKHAEARTYENKKEQENTLQNLRSAYKRINQLME